MTRQIKAVEPDNAASTLPTPLNPIVSIPPALKQLWNFYQVEALALDALRAPTRQLRRHAERQLIKIMASVKRHGFINPVLITADNELITGVARVEAARRLGIKLIPAIRITHLSTEEIRAFRIADNRLVELAEWDDENLALELKELSLNLDFNLDLTGFESAEVDLRIESLSAQPAVGGDPADDQLPLPVTPVSRRGDIWLLGHDHRLICGDALQEAVYEQLMQGDLARMVMADVPYNVPVHGHVSGLGKVRHKEFAMASGEMTEEEFTNFLITALVLSRLHLVPGGVAFLWIDGRHTHEMTTAQRAARFNFLNLVCWAKTNAGLGSLYRSQTELVFVFKKGNEPHINNVQLGRFGRYRSTLWSYPGANSFGKNRDQNLADHPTKKDNEMIADAIRDVTHRGDIVLDNFVGAGTTILAAERTGRRAWAIEIEPGYVDVAIRRWSTMTGKQAVLESTGQTFDEVAVARKEGTSSALEARRYRVRTRAQRVLVAAAEG